MCARTGWGKGGGTTMGRFPEDPLTPVTSGGRHVRRARARAGTAPVDRCIASGIFAAARAEQFPPPSM